MAERQTIQTGPYGLLGLLRITGGDWPHNLGDTLAPTLETMPFYVARSRVDRATAPTNVNAVNSGVVLAVPQNEIWLVETMNASITALAAGQVAGFQLGYQLVSGGNMAVLAQTLPGLATLPAIGDFLQIGFWCDNRLILPPGACIAAQVTRAIGANATMVVSATVTVLTQ